MQVLKDEVLNRIKKVAVECFLEYGYTGTSMREIGKRANISVGNVYRYFASKEALYDYIVEPAIQLLKDSQTHSGAVSFPFLDVDLMSESKVIDQLIALHMNYREAMFLLLLRNSGTKYEQIKKMMCEVMVDEIKKYIKETYGENQTLIKGDLYPKVVATAIIEGICVILEDAEDDYSFVFNMIQFLELNIKSVARYLNSVHTNETNFRRISDEEINNYFCNRRNIRGAGNDRDLSRH